MRFYLLSQHRYRLISISPMKSNSPVCSDSLSFYFLFYFSGPLSLLPGLNVLFLKENRFPSPFLRARGEPRNFSFSRFARAKKNPFRIHATTDIFSLPLSPLTSGPRSRDSKMMGAVESTQSPFDVLFFSLIYFSRWKFLYFFLSGFDLVVSIFFGFGLFGPLLLSLFFSGLILARARMLLLPLEGFSDGFRARSLDSRFLSVRRLEFVYCPPSAPLSVDYLPGRVAHWFSWRARLSLSFALPSPWKLVF